jgi:catechol 2,3-dioxygenase-like lactoylglutathione lyase family enzyme
MKLDHIEIIVPDREAAVAWYDEWLGFKSMPEHAEWAEMGPLMMTNDGGDTMLALFVGSAPAAGEDRGWRRVAFRTNAVELMHFTKRYKSSGQTISAPIDHDRSWSVYFQDPWGNSLELTTYDYEALAALKENSQ